MRARIHGKLRCGASTRETIHDLDALTSGGGFAALLRLRCYRRQTGNLAELLVRNGLARIYGTRTPLPDGRGSRTYLRAPGPTVFGLRQGGGG